MFYFDPEQVADFLAGSAASQRTRD
jgi:hypothetical protein